MLEFACVLNILGRTLEEKIKENDKKRSPNLLLENYVNNPLKVFFSFKIVLCVCYAVKTTGQPGFYFLQFKFTIHSTHSFHPKL